MASKAMIQDMLTCFCNLYRMKTSEELTNSWCQALNRFDDSSVIKGGEKAMEECQRMPTPSELISRMPARAQEEESEYIIREGVTCGQCGHIGMGIKEAPLSDIWCCRQCYTGLTPKQYRERMAHLAAIVEKKKTPAHKQAEKVFTAADLPALTIEQVVKRQQELLVQAEQLRDEPPF